MAGDPLSREMSVPVPSPADPKASRRSFLPSLAGIFLVEVIVLVALAVAMVAYVNWSSEVAWAEFLAASKMAVPAPGLPLREVKGKAACDRRA
jgi:hypothetical protein